jgi:hypothetical protein
VLDNSFKPNRIKGKRQPAKEKTTTVKKEQKKKTLLLWMMLADGRS